MRTAACFNATPKQPLLVAPASSTCGSPRPPPRAVGPPSPPHPTPTTAPSQPRLSRRRGCPARYAARPARPEAAGHKATQKQIKPNLGQRSFGAICVFSPLPVFILSHRSGEGCGRGWPSPFRRRLLQLRSAAAFNCAGWGKGASELADLGRGAAGGEHGPGRGHPELGGR